MKLISKCHITARDKILYNNSFRILLISFFIVIVFAVVELVFGYWSHSLALISDAGHMVADSLSLILASFAAWLVRKPASFHNTFGFARAEVLTAFVSSLFLIIIIIAIAIETIQRLFHPETVTGSTVILIASLGLLVNIIVAILLHRGKKNINIAAAFLHVISDLLGSITALIAGIVIIFTHWMPIDPILSLVICVLIAIATIRLLWKTTTVLMESVPKEINLAQIGKIIQNSHEVLEVYDLHVWALSPKQLLLSAHVKIKNLEKWPTIHAQIKNELRNKFNIEHVTIQPEL